MGWQDDIIPADFTVEHKGAAIPAREHDFFKSAPDLPTFLKSAYEAHSEVGRRLPIPTNDADKAKWKEQHLPKLQEAGLIDKPTQPPAKYELTRPAELPDGAWNDNLEAKAQEWGRKHGLSQDAVAEAFGLYQEALGEFGKAVEIDRGSQALKIKEWADKEGIQLEQIDAALARFNSDPEGWDEETAKAVSKSGLADNPLVVKAIYKLMTDSGMFDTRNDGGSMEEGNQALADAAREANDIVRNKANPKYEAYHKGDKDVNAYVQELFKKAHPGTLEI